jgi:tetratricopeptide (TPR) repeat protein
MAIDRVKVKINADKLLMANKVPEAIREYQKLVEDNPRDITTLSQLGNLHLRVGNKNAAVPIFIKVAELFNKNGFAMKAVASLKIAVREDPNNLRAWELLAELSEQQGFVKEARTAYEKVAELVSGGSDVEAILRVNQKLLDIDPENLRVRLHVGDLLLKKGNKQDAIKHYVKAGRSLAAQGKTKEAARVYERALQIDPENISLLEGVAKDLVSQKHSDQAIGLLDGLLERNPDSMALKALKVDVLVQSGEYARAKADCLALLRAQPENRQLLARAVRILSQLREFDLAASLLEPVRQAGSQNDLQAAEALYKDILKTASGHIPSLKGLSGVYRRAGNAALQANVLSTLTDAALAAGDLPTARQASLDLLELEPQSAQYRERLRTIEAKMGLGKEPPSEPKAPEAAAFTEDSINETGESEIEVVIGDLDLPLAAKPAAQQAEPEIVEPAPAPEPEQPPSAAEVPQEEIAIELDEPGVEPESAGEAAAPEVAQEPAPLDAMEGEMIREQLAEAEVFLKYGLSEKAIGSLQGVLKRLPDHIQAHQKLITIFKSLSKKDKAVRQILKLAEIFKKQGDDETCATLLEEARAIDPNHKAIQEFEEPQTPAAARFSTEALMSGVSAASPKAKARKLELDLQPIEVLSAEEAPPKAKPAEPEESIVIDLSEAEADSALAEQREAAERVEEIEFYLSQDLLQEARRAIDSLGEKYRENPRVALVRLKVEEAEAARARAAEAEAAPKADHELEPPKVEVPEIVEASGEPAAAEQAPVTEEPAQEISLAIETEPPQKEPEPAATEASRSRTKMKVTAEELLEESLAGFGSEKAPEQAKSDEYYDLAAELGAALDGLDRPEEALFDEEKSPEEMSFEEVFKEFKKGVEKKVGEEDYSTHYNLGIAYKEMDLVDEAIGEFQIAARSPEFFVECCSMLGVCFRQKGLHDLAEKWYRKGLDAKGFSEEIYVGLKYDLAETFEEQGRKRDAEALYKEVYAANANYRDVKNKIRGK